MRATGSNRACLYYREEIVEGAVARKGITAPWKAASYLGCPSLALARRRIYWGSPTVPSPRVKATSRPVLFAGSAALPKQHDLIRRRPPSLVLSRPLCPEILHHRLSLPAATTSQHSSTNPIGTMHTHSAINK